MTAPKQTTGSRHFHEELAQLKQRLLDMSGQAERLVDLAIKSLLERDRAIAEEVIAGDKLLNDLEVEIEQRAVRLLALQQPMARDLRFLVGAIKVSSDLERVGDHAVNIAESAEHLIEHGGRLTPTPAIEDMARRARAMLGDALDAFLRADGALGREVCKADDAVDALHDSVFRVLLTHMMENPQTIGQSAHLRFGLRERFKTGARRISERQQRACVPVGTRPGPLGFSQHGERGGKFLVLLAVKTLCIRYRPHVSQGYEFGLRTGRVTGIFGLIFILLGRHQNACQERHYHAKAKSPHHASS